MILEAFAGPGGISEALRMVLLDVPALGIELDADACATAEAAGHERLQADVSMLDLRPYVGRVVGFCAGPPCQSFSAAGRQLGKLDKPRIVAHIERIRKAGRWLHYSREGWHDPRSPLVLEVLRYALTLRPEWVVLEQVPAVLPLWELVADVLRDHGWHVEARVLQAEQYGSVAPCAMHFPANPALSVTHRSMSVKGWAFARSGAGTWFDLEPIDLARTVVDAWAAAISLADVSVATWLKQGLPGATSDDGEPPMPPGGVVEEWTSAVTSGFELPADIAENIVSSWSRWLDALSLAEKWSIMSMDQRTTTTRAILSCIAATLITGPGTGLASLTAGCGLCLDVATPQTRKRAILVARRCLPGCPREPSVCVRSRGLLPVPTHRPYRKGIPREAGDQSLLPWVSMADALGWGMTARLSHTVTAGGTGSGGGVEPIGNYSRPVMEREREVGRWALRQSAMANATVRALGEPAPTITAGHDRAERQWVRFGNQAHSAVRSTDEPVATVRFSERVNAIDWLPSAQARNAGPGAQRDPRGLDDPSYTIRAQGSGSHPSGVEWVSERPAPTIVGTRRSSDGMLVGRQLADPTDRRDIGGHSGERGIGGSQLAAVRVSVQEAAVLQSYRPDYPWRGSKSAQYRQVGDSAPPVLMAAIIGNLTKR